VLDLVGEKHETHTVAVSRGAESEHGCDFGGEVALRLLSRADDARCAHIDDDRHREFALLAVFLDMRDPGSG